MDLEAISTAAQQFGERHGITQAADYYKAQFWDGNRDFPTLHFDDVSGIPFLHEIKGVEEYQHRARLRANDGDIFATVSPLAEGFEDYCKNQLGLGSPEHIFAPPPNGKVAIANGCMTGKAFERIVECAKTAGGMLIEPYMGIETVWQLAKMVSEAADVPVQVIAPFPEVMWAANDKVMLTELVFETAGSEHVVELNATSNIDEMVQHLLRISKQFQRVAIKRPRCASAMGNALFLSEEIQKMSVGELTAEVTSVLAGMEWPEGEEVLACAWEEADHSPSTQWWIPPKGKGTPRIDGIYEQLLQGEECVFLGSRPSTLPEAVNNALVEQSLPVAIGLQELGFVGRCSFDHLVVGDPHGEFSLRIIECNGRWGGTSTPMNFVDLVVPGERPPYRAQDVISPALAGVPFTEIAARLGDRLYDVNTGKGSYLLYNVGPLASDGKLDVIGFADTQEMAEALLNEELPKLLGI